ncbi:MAG: adenosine deaminase [Chloroflexi bacterium]|nr:adenosine deaminase [Chloroflexota bacterium]
MPLTSFIRAMPKVELHVHLEGSIRPETLLKLARRHDVALPANTVEGLRQWYTFTDFPHFVDIYVTMSRCLKTPDDIELITREFLIGQAEQNIVHSEVTYTAYTLYQLHRLPFDDQLAAINRARAWAAAELNTTMTLTIDIAREVSPDDGLISADWAIRGLGNGVTGFGLGGNEVGNPPEKHKPAFDRARAAGLASLPHAGETVGPESIWGALNSLKAERIGHGVRCLEDPKLIDELRARQIPLEVCPTSNVCLKVAPSLAEHPLPKLLEAGLYVTLNSDDPPMFNTTLTDEWLAATEAFGWGLDVIEKLSLNAVRATLLPADEKAKLEKRFEAETQIGLK